MKKAALITGASGDIGFAVAEMLAKRGFDLILQHNKRQISSEYEKFSELYGTDISVYECDFSDGDKTAEFAENLAENHKNTDIIVNNAGMSSYGLFQDLSASDIEKIISVNLKAPMIITGKIIPNMVRQKHGCIINISSVWGETGGSCESAYSAAKAGLIGFTKALAKELAPSGIRVNCITPGVIDTGMLSVFSGDDLENLREEIPLGRLGKPSDVASAVEFLISENSSYITGAVLKVNGGFLT